VPTPPPSCQGLARRWVPFHGGFRLGGTSGSRTGGGSRSRYGVNGEGSRRPRAPAGGSRSRYRNGEGSRHPRAPAARGAGAGGPVPAPRPAPLAFPHPDPPLVHDACERDEEGSKGSLSRPLPIPCGDGTRGAGSCREVLCSGGPRGVNGCCSPRDEIPGQEQLVSTQAPHQAGLLRILPVHPLETKSLWLGRLASPRLASPRLASPRLASPRLAWPHLTHAGVSTRFVHLSRQLRARSASLRPQPRGSRPRRGWARGANGDLGARTRPVRMRRAPAGGRGGGMQGGRDGGPALAPRRPPPLPPVREGGVSPRRFRYGNRNYPPVREGGVSPRRSRHGPGTPRRCATPT
jgi:hypothetical protein